MAANTLRPFSSTPGASLRPLGVLAGTPASALPCWPASASRQPRRQPAQSCNLLLFGNLLALRRKLRGELDPGIANSAGSALDGMRTAIINCNRQMRDCIAGDAAVIESVLGCGSVNAGEQCADGPELGSCDRFHPRDRSLRLRCRRAPLRAALQGLLRMPVGPQQAAQSYLGRRNARAGSAVHRAVPGTYWVHIRVATGRLCPQPRPSAAQ